MDRPAVGFGPLDQPLSEVGTVRLGVVLRLLPLDIGIPTVRDNRCGPCSVECYLRRIGIVARPLGVGTESVDEQEHLRRVVERPHATSLEGWPLRRVEEPARSDDRL